MATGLHPLKDYPETYEGGNKVKYRSHDYQALPDTEQVRTSGTFGDYKLQVILKKRTFVKLYSYM